MAKRILLVEDEEFISFIYKRQFEIAGFIVETARDGLSGLALIQNKTYDLVLLDIMIPGMNGMDVLKAVKTEEKTKNTPIIMLTNLAQDNIMQEAFQYGAEGYWIKANLSPMEVVSEINQYFKSKEV